jgi:hypothetical protein
VKVDSIYIQNPDPKVANYALRRQIITAVWHRVCYIDNEHNRPSKLVAEGGTLHKGPWMESIRGHRLGSVALVRYYSRKFQHTISLLTHPMRHILFTATAPDGDPPDVVLMYTVQFSKYERAGHHSFPPKGGRG